MKISLKPILTVVMTTFFAAASAQSNTSALVPMPNSIEISENVEAPVEKNQLIGKITAKSGDNIIGEFSIVSKEEIRKTNFKVNDMDL